MRRLDGVESARRATLPALQCAQQGCALRDRRAHLPQQAHGLARSTRARAGARRLRWPAPTAARGSRGQGTAPAASRRGGRAVATPGRPAACATRARALLQRRQRSAIAITSASSAIAIGSDERRRRRWRRCARIRDEVADREIGFMADSADDGNRRLEHRLRDRQLVERPQVFDRPAATADDQDIDFRARVGCRDRCARCPQRHHCLAPASDTG